MKIIKFINVGVLFFIAHNLFAINSNDINGFEYSGNSYLTFAYAFKVLLALVVMALLALATIYVIKKNNLRIEKTEEKIKISAVKTIFSDKKLILVEIKNKEYLLAISSTGITLIDSFNHNIEKGKRNLK